MNVSFRFAVIGLVGLMLAGCPQVPNPDPLPPAPKVAAFTASASQVAAGDTVSLSWKVENASTVRIDDLSLGAVSGVSGSEGTVDVAVSGDTTFVLSARNDRGASASAVLSIRVSGSAREPLLLAVPERIGAGQSSALAWSAPGASAVTLTASPGGAIDVGGQSASGTVTVSPAVTTEYTLTANGLSRSVTVSVTPTIVALTASASVPDAGTGDAGAFDAGTTIHVAWQTSGATRLQLNGVGRGTLAEITDAASIAMGSFDEPLPASVDPAQFFTYELVATGAGGTTNRSVIFGVPGSPAVVSFTGPQVARFGDGGVATFSWSTVEAAQLSLLAGDVEIYRAPSAQVATGSVTVPVPSSDTAYTVVARGERGGEASKTLLLDVVAQPTVSISATPTSVAAGSPVTLSWTGTHIRNVVIREVGYGVVFSATGMNDTGSAQLTPNSNVTYEVEVNNSLGDTATASTSVTVTDPITLNIAETGALRYGQNITASWTVPGGTASIVGLPHSNVDVRPGSTDFDDIAMTGTALAYPDSTRGAVLTTSFRMPYLGRVVGETIYVSRHGYLAFGDINGGNSSDVALPSGLLEDMAIAPYWESLTLGNVYWQLKSVAGQDVLIVQWSMTTATFQAKLYASGQIDFEYKVLPSSPAGRTGVTGWLRDQTVVAPATAAVNTGFTFFGPVMSPVTLKALAPGPLRGQVVVGSARLRVSADLAQVVRPTELVTSEVLSGSAAGAAATWAELRNATNAPVDLSGWSFGLADGGAIPLSGTVPPRGLLVVGASTDPSINGDAGVQVALADFAISDQASLKLQRSGVSSVVALDGSDGGTALVNDVGPFLFTSTGGAQTCAATTTYGALGLRGTPGSDSTCGFGYELQPIPFGYFDISDGGTSLGTTFDDALYTVDISSAPIPFFGVSHTSMVVSTNGFVTFAAASTTSSTDYLGSAPRTTDANLLVAAFADNLSATGGIGNLLGQRVGAGVDPAAPLPHWIVQWHRYRVFGCSDDINFQLKFFDDGAIEVHFAGMRSGSSSQCAAGASAVSWLENATGTQALVISADSTSPGIRPYTAFRYSPR
ncbi:MAG: hypothetical protein DI536_16035 [Archangium gephyra]|uniref:LTD domain-containing protein n=1 Tax=Archangium gephyra TaxID=48 RepID=A0A2W5V7P8_9BACT|nr:MAG: hypothetical protein DI536_16035 [Archangium gephyra]